MADPREASNTQNLYQRNRFEQQQGPLANAFAYDYGRGAESNYGDYNDIMNRFRGVADGGYDNGEASASWGPSKISYSDPFKSYGGYEEFSKTGGYSGADIANMRSRGVSPIRAAYANAGREIGRQRSLQGGYSPNAVAAQAKMAREQGQAAADATQNVEAGLAEARNRGRLAGLGGMSGIETSRLGADLDVAKFNANAQMQADQWNAAQANSRAAEGRGARLGALNGMVQMYGTTPGMASTFGNLALQSVGQGGQFGDAMMKNTIYGQQLPGQYEQAMSRINTGIDTARNASGAATIAYPWLNQGNKNQRKPTGGATTPIGGSRDWGRAGRPPQQDQFGNVQYG